MTLFSVQTAIFQLPNGPTPLGRSKGLQNMSFCILPDVYFHNIPDPTLLEGCHRVRKAAKNTFTTEVDNNCLNLDLIPLRLAKPHGGGTQKKIVFCIKIVSKIEKKIIKIRFPAANPPHGELRPTTQHKLWLWCLAYINTNGLIWHENSPFRGPWTPKGGPHRAPYHTFARA